MKDNNELINSYFSIWEEYAKVDEVVNIFNAFKKGLQKNLDELDSKNSSFKNDVENTISVISSKLDDKVDSIKADIINSYSKLDKKIKEVNSKTDTTEIYNEINSLYSQLIYVEELVKKVKAMKGDKGDYGDRPAHEWDGTKIRFQNKDGSWGGWTELKGKDGVNGTTYSVFGGSSGIERIKANGYVVREGATEINFGSNLTVTRTGNGVSVSATGGSSGGGSLASEVPTGTINGVNDTFTVANEPLFVVIDGMTTFNGGGYSYSGGTITVDSLNVPVQTIVSVYSSGGSTVETPTGTVDGSNVTFTTTSEPLFIIIDGLTRFDGYGYTYSGGTITVDSLTPPTSYIRAII